MVEVDVQQNRINVRHQDGPQMVWQPSLEGRRFPTAFAGTMGGLLDAIASGRRPAVTGEDNLWTLALVEAACRSAAEDRAVAPRDLLRADAGDGGAEHERAGENGML
jgi:predicted dehydrogenase